MIQIQLTQTTEKDERIFRLNSERSNFYSQLLVLSTERSALVKNLQKVNKKITALQLCLTRCEKELFKEEGKIQICKSRAKTQKKKKVWTKEDLESHFDNLSDDEKKKFIEEALKNEGKIKQQ